MTSRLDSAAKPTAQLKAKSLRRARTAEAAPLPASAESIPAANSPGARLLTVLEAVAGADGPVAAVDLVPKVGLPKPTVHRLCTVLEDLGYLQREPGTKRFVIGQRQQRLALDSLINAYNRGARHAVLEALAREVGETVNVTVLSGNWVVYIDRVESHWPLRIHLQPGSRVPLHCGASGLLYLSLMPAAQRRRLLTAAPLERWTENTITDPERIEERLKTIRKTRVGIEVEEFMRGLIGLAVPVYDGRGRICATVSMHAPTARFTVDEVLASVPALQRAAEAISNLLVR
ncbi:MAG TPA: IclR family transcriptional regulator [Pelomicrobium sp.]|nr:IclR family transcriptional regulator [Pelomicrobium sp.]